MTLPARLTRTKDMDAKSGKMVERLVAAPARCILMSNSWTEIRLYIFDQCPKQFDVKR